MAYVLCIFTLTLLEHFVFFSLLSVLLPISLGVPFMENMYVDRRLDMSSDLVNNNDMGAMAVSKVLDLRLCVYFIKYCKETTGKSVSSDLLMNINDLGAMAVSSVV